MTWNDPGNTWLARHARRGEVTAIPRVIRFWSKSSSIRTHLLLVCRCRSHTHLFTRRPWSMIDVALARAGAKGTCTFRTSDYDHSVSLRRSPKFIQLLDVAYNGVGLFTVYLSKLFIHGDRQGRLQVFFLRGLRHLFSFLKKLLNVSIVHTLGNRILVHHYRPLRQATTTTNIQRGGGGGCLGSVTPPQRVYTSGNREIKDMK